MQGTYAIQGATTTDPYNGKYRGYAAFIVGFGSPHEKVFRADQRVEAKRYAKTATTEPLRIIKVNATQLPVDIGLELFGR